MNAIVELNDGLGAVFAGGGSVSLSFIGSIFGAIALGVFALLQEDGSNDDDDSSPGGGLMQPVS